MFSTHDWNSFDTLPAYFKSYKEYNSISPFKNNIIVIGHNNQWEEWKVCFEEAEVWSENWGLRYMELDCSSNDLKISDALYHGMSNALNLQHEIETS